jgi:hypothetical protein
MFRHERQQRGDEAARMAAIEILARLISRLLQGDPATEASDE